MAQLLTGTRIYGTGTVDTQLFVSGTNSATSTTTGALQVVGGVGIGGNLHVGGIIYGAILGTATTATNSDNVKTVLSTSTSVFFPVFVDSNNATAGYEAVYSSSTFTIIPSSGNVGIGVATPTEKLHVAGNYLLLKNTADTAAGAVFDSGSTLGQNTQILLRDRGSDKWAVRKNSANNFDIYGSAVGAAALTIFSSTNFIGIGATVIEDVLHVRRDSTATSTGIVIQNRSASGLPEAGIKFITGSFDLADTRYAEISSTGTSSPSLIFKTANGATPIERMRITALGGISFGASGTAYGVSGQILQSNGNAAPTWISTGSLAAANATTATHLSGGVAGQIPYQTAPGVTAFLSTGTAGDVLVSNGSSAATYNNTLRLAGATNATSTSSGALQVVGGVGVGGDLFIQGDIRTNDTLFNLINANATTVNFAGDATTLTMGASGSGTTNVRNNLTVNGNLTVQGTTTIVDSTVTNIADPIITLGGGTGNSAPTADDNKDRGVAFKWVNNGGTTSTGFFGYDDSTGYLTYVQTATITNEVVSGTKGAMDVNLAGGTAMSIHYQSAADTTAFLAAGSSGYLLQTNGTGSAPTWVSASGVSAGSATNADNIRTILQTGNTSYYPTFVDSNNASAAYESLYTTSSFSINPMTGAVSILGLTTSTANKLQIGQTSVPATTFTSTTHLRIIGTANTATDEVFITLVRDRNPSIQYAGGAAISLGSYITPTAGSAPSSRLTFSLKSSTDNSDVVNVQVMSLLDNGNVGIGTQSPGARLDIKLAADGDFLIGRHSASTAKLVYAYQSASDGYLELRTGADVIVTKLSGYTGTPSYFLSNVGVGTTSTSAKLHVTSSGEIARFESSGGSGRYIRFNDSSVTKFNFIVGVQQNVDNGFEITPSTTAGGSTFSTPALAITSAGGISFGGTASYGTSGQVLQSNGNAAPTWVAQSTIAAGSAPLTNTYVGYGSASNLLTGSSNFTWDGTKLLVSGTSISPYIKVSGTGASYSYIQLDDSSSNGYLIKNVSAGTGNGALAGALYTYTDNNKAFQHIHSGTPLFTILSTGFVGIGHTAPAYKLSVITASDVWHAQFGTSGGKQLRIGGSTTNGSVIGAYNDDTNSSPASLLLQRDGGNVGICTASPSAKLEIGPGWSSGAGLKINYGNSSGTIEAVNFISNGGTNGVIGMQMVSAGVGDLWLGGSGGRTLTLYRDGNVGINSTAPASKLTVEGSGTANESVARFNNQGDYASRIWLRQSSRSAYLSVSGSTGDTLATGSLPYGLLIGLSGNPSPVQFYNGTSGAVKMTIDTVGNVGIGTTTPTAKFEVAGAAGQLFSVSDSFTGTIFSANDVSGIPSIEVLDTGLVKFAQYGGQVAINTGTVASSTASLSVYGMIYTMGTLGEIRASSEITAYFSSDRRLKENIKLIENPITIIDQIRGVTFDWTDEHMARRGGEDGYFVRKHDIGVIAQEVQAVLPELVGTREDGYLAVKYEKMVALLIEAIKAQQKTIDSLVKDLDNVKEFINNFKNGI